MKTGFSLDLLLPMGRILFTACMGYTLFKVIDGENEFEDAIKGIVVGFLGLVFYKDGLSLITTISEQLAIFLGDHMGPRTLQEQILAAIQKSPSVQSKTIPSIGEVFGQMWRAGVWGVVSSVIELVFLLSDYLLIAIQKVFSKQILFFFPIGCGLYPMFPKIFANLSLYAIELALWRPMLVIIHEITGLVASDYLANDPTQGLQIIAVELVTIYLIISIPKTTHSVMSGALSGDVGVSGSFVQMSKKALGWIRG